MSTNSRSNENLDIPMSSKGGRTLLKIITIPQQRLQKLNFTEGDGTLLGYLFYAAIWNISGPITKTIQVGLIAK